MRILEKRKSQGVLVPLLEELLEKPVEPDDEEDMQFLLHLMEARKVEREEGVFSPSMLASCLRQSYFAKTGKEKRPARSPRTNSYFLDGNFRHYKWQFAIWKLHRAGKLYLYGCELRVYHPSGDFVGTIDALVRIGKTIYVVDIKGMHVRAFQDFMMSGLQTGHRVQIGGYGLILSLVTFSPISDGKGKLVHPASGIELLRPKGKLACILLAESKGGPDQRGHVIGLREEIVEISKTKSEVKRRMQLLRKAVEHEEIPAPACVSIRHKEFQECPFAYYCRDEVKEIQKQRERLGSRDPKKLQVSISKRTRTDSANGVTNRRKKNSARSHTGRKSASGDDSQ